MIKILYHRKFIKDFKKIPHNIRKKLASLEEVFKIDPFHQNLFTKKLQGKLQFFYSFRITREYRVVFQFTAESEVVFLAVGHRKDIYAK